MAPIQDTAARSAVTLLKAYTKQILPLFSPVDNAKKIIALEKKIGKTMYENCKKFNIENIINNSTESSRYDLVEFVETGILISNKTSFRSNLSKIASIYNEAIYKMRNDIDKIHQKHLDLTRSSVQFKNLNIDIAKEFETLNNIATLTKIRTIDAWKLPEFNLSYDTIQNIKFPDLNLHFDFKSEYINDGMKIIPGDNANYETKRGQFFHPHVNRDGSICFGAGERAAKKLWRLKKIVPLSQLIINILSTYNPTSPYLKLQFWKKLKHFVCDNCGTDVDEDHVRFIDGSQQMPSCNKCCLKIGNKYKWKNNYVYSQLNNNWIPKQNATKALTKIGIWDYFENILSMPEFVSCPKCFSVVHQKHIHDTDAGITCVTCLSKMQQRKIAEIRSTAPAPAPAPAPARPSDLDLEIGF